MFYLLIGNFDLILVVMMMTEMRAKYVEITYPVVSDPISIVIKNDLEQMHDYTLFLNILNYETWFALLGLCLLPAIIIGIQDELIGTQKFIFGKFILRFFESKLFD